LDNKFEKRRQGHDKDTGLAYTMWGPMLGKRFLIFVDDFNMPKRETYGAQVLFKKVNVSSFFTTSTCLNERRMERRFVFL